jgi:hypothetical protein
VLQELKAEVVLCRERIDALRAEGEKALVDGTASLKAQVSGLCSSKGCCHPFEGSQASASQGNQGIGGWHDFIDLLTPLSHPQRISRVTYPFTLSVIHSVYVG